MIGEPAADRIFEAVCEAMKMLYLKGLITPLAGNISVRISKSIAAVTPSRKLKFLLRPEDLALVSIENGEVLRGPKPSSEIRMHIGVYRCCPEARAVVHVHGLYAPIFAEVIANHMVLDTEAKRMGLRVCFVDEVEPGSEELASRVVEKVCAENCRAIVLKNHGIVAVGRSLEEALELAELVELSVKRSVINVVLHRALRG